MSIPQKRYSKKLEKHPKHLTQPHQQDERNKLIKERVYLYKNALRIPPALNQFNEPLDEKDTKDFLDFFTKYTPETRSEKKRRLKSEDPKSGPKPVLNKFGLRHVVSLIENKKAKLVLIAADVCPIEAVVFLPTLCMKMGVSYVIVKSKACLGKLVNLKETTCVALCESSVKDSGEFKKLINKANGIFADNYEITMKKWGGGVLLREKEEK